MEINNNKTNNNNNNNNNNVFNKEKVLMTKSTYDLTYLLIFIFLRFLWRRFLKNVLVTCTHVT